MGFTQPGIGLGIRSRMMGSRKTVPPRMLRIYKTELSTIHFDAGRGETDCAVWTLPHLLKFEFLDTRLIGRDGRTFDADLVLLDRFCSLDCYAIVCLPFAQLSGGWV
jgi:hypothetical protein